jgi:membrane-associated protease RseP (regulator of RpoE activity)
MATRLTIRDKWIFSLAIGILLAFFIFFGLAFVDGLYYSSPNDYSGIQIIATALGALPGGIIGYYFGNQPVQSWRERAQREERRGSTARRTVVRTSNDALPLALEEIESLRQQVRVRDEIIRNDLVIIQRLFQRATNG